jgi:hypothetical protein
MNPFIEPLRHLEEAASQLETHHANKARPHLQTALTIATSIGGLNTDDIKEALQHNKAGEQHPREQAVKVRNIMARLQGISDNEDAKEAEKLALTSMHGHLTRGLQDYEHHRGQNAKTELRLASTFARFIRSEEHTPLVRHIAEANLWHQDAAQKIQAALNHLDAFGGTGERKQPEPVNLGNPAEPNKQMPKTTNTGKTRP